MNKAHIIPAIGSLERLLYSPSHINLVRPVIHHCLYPGPHPLPFQHYLLHPSLTIRHIVHIEEVDGPNHAPFRASRLHVSSLPHSRAILPLLLTDNVLQPLRSLIP